MADDTTTQTAAPDTTDQTQAILQQLLRQTISGQSAQPQEPEHSGDNRTWGSLLGQALVGGAGPGSTDAANEAAGLRGLQSIGLGMMSGSNYSHARQSLGSIVADAIGGAQQGNYEQQAAMLQYQKQQQEMQLERIKTALPLLTQLRQMQAVKGLPNPLASTAPGANTSIAAVGAPGGPLGPGTAPINAAGDSATRKASEGGPPAPGTPAAATAQQVHDFWISKGFTEPQVAGIMAGGPGSESDFNPTVSGDKGTSYGLYQHHGPRLDAMRQYFGLTGSQMPSADQQNQYAAYEISPKGPLASVGAQLAQAKTPAEAAAIWTSGFGVPADKTEIGRRALGAGRFMGLYGQPQPPGAPVVAGAPQAPPAASTDAALPVPPIPPPGGPPAVRAAPIPAGRPTGPPIITDQPAGGNIVAGPPGSTTVGRPLPPSPAVPGDVNAIIGGMTDVGASPTTLAPGAPTAGPAAPPVVAAATTTPPAVLAPQQTTQQPTDTRPDSALTFEEYAARHMLQPTPEEKARFQVTVDPAIMARAESARQTAAQQLQLARAGAGGDPDKALAQYNVANDAVNKLQQEATTVSVKNQIDWFENQKKTLAENWRAERTQAAQAAAAQALEAQKGQQAIDLAKVQAGQTWHQKLQEQAATDAQENTIKPMSAASAKAHQMNLGLSQMLPLLQDLPKGGGALGTVLEAHPDLAPLFNTAGILTDKQADAVRLINGLVSNISTEMKPTGLGALREYEWDAFKAQLPSMLSTPAGQQKAVALLMNMNNRIQSEHSWMSNYFSRKVPDETTPGRLVPAHNLESDNPTESVQQRMDRELGPIIPSAPSGTSQAQWEQSLKPGQPYYKTWAMPDSKNPGQPLRDAQGNIRTTKTLEVRPWQ
jgi:hypothetical protein